MADFFKSLATDNIDKLLTSIVYGKMALSGYFASWLRFQKYLLSFIAIDYLMLISLSKGFLVGSFVIFGMCYLDAHGKQRLHATDVANKVSL